MRKWKECNLGEILEPKGYIRGPFGSALKRGEMVKTGVPVYEQKNAIYNSREFRFFIGSEKLKELARFQVKTNDLLISCSGTVGKISIIKEEDPKGIISQALLILRPDITKITLMYLYYFLSSKQGFELITQASHGSVQINIAERKVVENIPLFLPPLPEQRAIASVLSSLDDKIDLLHRQNKTLESLAETLWRYYFENNQQSGWKECLVSDLANHEKHSVHPNKIKDMIFEHYSIPAFDESKMPTKEFGASIQSNKYAVYGDTILFSKLNPHKDKRIWLIPAAIAPNSVCSTEFQVLRPKKKEVLYFLYGFLSHPNNYGEIATGVGGTSGSHQRIEPAAILKYPCFVPPVELLKEYNQMVEPIYSEVYLKRVQIENLVCLRDTLLPKLMNGEVRVAV